MGRPKNNCRDCGITLTDENRKYNRCLPCWRIAESLTSKRYWKHRRERLGIQPKVKEPKKPSRCKDCDSELTNDNKKGRRCIPCSTKPKVKAPKKPSNCIDCNLELTPDNRKGRRCIPCYSQHRNIRTKKHQEILGEEGVLRKFFYNYRSALRRKGIATDVTREDSDKEYYRRIEEKSNKLILTQQIEVEKASMRIAAIPDVEEQFDFRKEWLTDRSERVTTEYMRDVPLEIVEREYLRSIVDNDPQEFQDTLRTIYDLLAKLDERDNRLIKRSPKHYLKGEERPPRRIPKNNDDVVMAMLEIIRDKQPMKDTGEKYGLSSPYLNRVTKGLLKRDIWEDERLVEYKPDNLRKRKKYEY